MHDDRGIVQRMMTHQPHKKSASNKKRRCRHPSKNAAFMKKQNAAFFGCQYIAT